jgi:triosephosphate isomerase (TIM)
MRKKIVAGNWKMNGLRQHVIALTQELIDLMPVITNTEVVIIPPSIYIPLIRELLAINNSNMLLGAQNVYPKDSGAYTGELSGPMLEDFNCTYVLVGHSERRQNFHEDENFIAQKFHHVKESGMIPLLCVGETRTDREKGHTEQVIANQLLAVSSSGNQECFRNCVIAYEPVWAIGTGIHAEPEQVQKVHQFIRSVVKEINSQDAAQLSILYGGSVNEHNAKDLFCMPDVDGGLVGGASLNAKQFVDIVTCIN